MVDQNVALNKVKARIKALAAKTVDAGCSEEEALSAATKVGELLSLYNLSMDECDVREAKCITIKIDTGSNSRRPGFDFTAVALAEFADCKVWFSKGGWIYSANKRSVLDSSKHAFFGQESDIELVKYLYKVILTAYETESAAFRLTETYKQSRIKKRAYVSFQTGFGTRVSARLRELKRENDEALRRAHEERKAQAGDVADARVAEAHTYTDHERRASGVTGTALLVLKKQLVEQEFKAHGPKLSKSYSYTRAVDNAAYSSGYRAGDRVNLSRPVGGGSVGGYLK